MRTKPGVYVLSTGSELSSGRSIDTNAPTIARALAEVGHPIVGLGTLPDDLNVLHDEIEHIGSRGDVGLIVMTGGLGPTDDDHTVDVLARLSKKPTVSDEDSKRKLTVLAKRLKRRFDMEAANRQTRVVEGALVLKNERGLAPGMLLELAECVVAAMPGVPQEMISMLENELLPELERRYPGGDIARAVFHLYGVPESLFQARFFGGGDDAPLADVKLLAQGFRWGVTAGNGQLKVFLESDRSEDVESLVNIARKEYESQYLEKSADELLHTKLPDRALRIAAAESCTGGLIGKLLTDRPGSSRYFAGSIVAYENEAKINLLQVPRMLFESGGPGAVSAECAEAMARGARERYATDYAVAVTGIAGPGGGSPDKPVGLVYVGLAGPENRSKAEQLNIPLDRDRVRHYTAHLALYHLYRFIEW